MEQQTGSKLEKEYVKAVYCHPAYLSYMQSTSWATLDWPGDIVGWATCRNAEPRCGRRGLARGRSPSVLTAAAQTNIWVCRNECEGVCRAPGALSARSLPSDELTPVPPNGPLTADVSCGAGDAVHHICIVCESWRRASAPSPELSGPLDPF